MRRLGKQLTFTMSLAIIMGPIARPLAGQVEGGIAYSVEGQQDDGLVTALRATENGETHTLISGSKGMCLEIEGQRDFDGNGFIDALVRHITGCGGNCCADGFFFVSALGNGRFEVGEEFADSWADPVIEKWKGRWSAVISSTSEGIMNTTRPQEITRRFILEAGKAVEVEEQWRTDLESIVEMRSEIFRTEDDDERHSIEYDLDGDGKKDQITVRFWPRWGRMLWSVQFADGKKSSSDTGCKRIGVLATKTNGVNDLVCDQDTVLRWDGLEYR